MYVNHECSLCYVSVVTTNSGFTSSLAKLTTYLMLLLFVYNFLGVFLNTRESNKKTSKSFKIRPLQVFHLWLIRIKASTAVKANLINEWLADKSYRRWACDAFPTFLVFADRQTGGDRVIGSSKLSKTCLVDEYNNKFIHFGPPQKYATLRTTSAFCPDCVDRLAQLTWQWRPPSACTQGTIWPINWPSFTNACKSVVQRLMRQQFTAKRSAFDRRNCTEHHLPENTSAQRRSSRNFLTSTLHLDLSFKRHEK